ncbi:FtsK/SpoIIIE domain-containing protein [Streptomyces sp. NPDC020096]
MAKHLLLWALLVAGTVGALTRKWWAPRFTRWAEAREIPWRWWLLEFPVLTVRMRVTWRQVCLLNGLSISRRSTARVVDGVMVRGVALRPIPPRLGLPHLTRTGVVVRVRIHPGQTPGPFLAAAQALEHAWRVHGVRVASPQRGEVVITITAHNPLHTTARAVAAPTTAPLLSARVGRVDDGGPWLMNLRRIPHWLIVGATQSGKSTLLAAFIKATAPQPVALVGIDCKGGMELGLFSRRLSALATSRPEARKLLTGLVTEVQQRMTLCWSTGVRSIWELPEDQRPVPVVVIIDELAELYLLDGTREGREEAEQCSTLLLRLAQLGAALGVHLVVAGQRVGSDMGPRVTALRAQLGGRIVHRVHDEATAEMALGDLSPDAVAVAQTISEEEQGVAVATVGGRWVRARSVLVTTEEARQVASEYAALTPDLPALGAVVLEKEGGKAA